MLKALIALTFLATLLTGCTGLPAQNLNLHPDIQTTQKLPANTRIVLSIVDSRQSALVGQRLDRLKNRAPLSLVGAEEFLEHAVEHALENMGITQFTPGEFTLTVFIDELTYNAQIKSVLQEVTSKAIMRVQISKGGEHYTGKYSTEMTKSFVNTPTPADNEDLINKLVGNTLDRAFSDPKLMNFIRFK